VRIVQHDVMIVFAVTKAAVTRANHGDDGDGHSLTDALRQGDGWGQAAQGQGAIEFQPVGPIGECRKSIIKGCNTDFEADVMRRR